MKFEPKHPPRIFTVGNTVPIDIEDCGTLSLEADEQVTLVTGSGGEYDICRKDWGFYATPSLNGRLASFGLRAVLVRNRVTGRYFVLLVESGHEPRCEAYLEQECCDIVTWLDTTEALDRLGAALHHLAASETEDHGN